MKTTFWLSLQMSNMKPLSKRTVWAPLHCGHFLSGVFMCDLTDCAKSLNTLSNLHLNQEPQAVAPCYSCPLKKYDWAAFHLTDMNFVQSHSKFLFCFFWGLFLCLLIHSDIHSFLLSPRWMHEIDTLVKCAIRQTKTKKHILDIKDISFSCILNNLFHFILFIVSRFLVPTSLCQESECESLDWIITHTNPLCNDELCRGILFFFQFSEFLFFRLSFWVFRAGSFCKSKEVVSYVREVFFSFLSSFSKKVCGEFFLFAEASYINTLLSVLQQCTAPKGTDLALKRREGNRLRCPCTIHILLVQ